MFITLSNKATGAEINVMARAIVHFSPTSDGKDSIVQLATGETLAVEESVRSIRGYIRKLSDLDEKPKKDQAPKS
jgi:hypothetical protein